VLQLSHKHDYQEFRIGCAQLKVITHSGLELQVPLDGSARRLTRASCEQIKRLDAKKQKNHEFELRAMMCIKKQVR
jgi:hypothetical protein